LNLIFAIITPATPAGIIQNRLVSIIDMNSSLASNGTGTPPKPNVWAKAGLANVDRAITPNNSNAYVLCIFFNKKKNTFHLKSIMKHLIYISYKTTHKYF